MEVDIRFQLLTDSLLQQTVTVAGGEFATESARLFDGMECGVFFDIDHLLTNINLLTEFHGGPVSFARRSLRGVIRQAHGETSSDPASRHQISIAN